MNLIVDIRAEEFLARLRGAGDRLTENMRRVVTRLSVEVQAAVKDKLTGQVLHVRTGTLRRSINRVVTVDGANVIATIGTNVRYAGVHEYGFDGEVNVRAHVRKNSHPAPKSPTAFGKREKGEPGGTINVREYSRHMHMPERSFLRSTVRDFAPRIREELRAAALEAVL